METQKVDMFIISNANFFESKQIPIVREKLLNTDDSKWSIILTLQFKDPTLILVVSLLGGFLGIDRFIIGDTGLGVGKLLTIGGFGIWTIIDWFLIMSATRKRNFEKLRQIVY
jgi:TM2 domain-containing membrane protein YozV